MKKMLVVLMFLICSGLALAQCVDLDDNTTWEGKVNPWSETRYELTQDVILCPGTYHLDGGVVFSNNYKTLDCNGATLVGSGGTTGGIGIYVGRGYSSVNAPYQPHITIKNCNIRDYHTGIVNNLAYYTILENNNITQNNYGLKLTGTKYAVIRDNRISDNSKWGVIFEKHMNGWKTTDNELINNKIYANTERGIYLNNVQNNSLVDNEIKNSNYGIYLNLCEGNKIHNNHFDNNVNYQLSSSSENQWNTAITPDTNIIGGPNLGGNYWSDYTGADTDGDGIGQTPYPVGSGSDAYPLVAPTEAEEEQPEDDGTEPPVSEFEAQITAVLKENAGKVDLSQAPGAMRFFIGSPKVDVVILMNDKTNLTYGFLLRENRVMNFSKGGVIRPKYIIEMSEDAVRQIGGADDPVDQMMELYKKGEIRIKPQTFGSRFKFSIANKLAGWFKK